MTSKYDSALTRRLFLKAASASALAAAAPGDAPPIYLADMSKCLPASALTNKPQRGRWRLLPYETETFSGSMLVAGRNTGAPEVRYPLSQKGWHRVSLGLRSYRGGESATLVEVRLGRDSNSVMVRHAHGEEDRIDDYYWRTVELTGSDELVFSQWRRRLVPDDAGSVGNSCSAVWLAYIKLEPLDRPEEARLREERRSGRTRVLFCHNDAWSYTYRYRPTSEAEIRREIEPFRDTDFSRIYWEAGMGDRMYYPTKIGRITAADDWIDDPYRIGDRLAKETWRTWREKGIDPLKVAAEHAHAIGLEFHATYRPSGFHFPVPQDEWNEGGAYDRHPEWRGQDKVGRPTPRLSYAFQGVRDLVAGFLKEISGYEIDGVCMAYNRRPPYLEYEQPLLDGFRKTHGKDARAVGDRDREWLKYRATFMTSFMKQVRQVMEAARREKGRSRPLEVSAIVLSSEMENLYYGLDLEEWVKQGLLDTIMPYSSVRGINSSRDSWTDPAEAEFFYRITGDSSCRLALNLMPRRLSPDQYRERAHALYEAGSEHFFFWDTNARNDFSPSWDVLRRLGHRDELARWADDGKPAYEAPGSHLRKLGTWNLGYETPG
ncbi:MAG: family 10 glycosylhydrolase [Bryobacterales bacterium]|nr:family 10 glycosylhydrolase [Bryobacterales bacterium]MDE0296391.1 family 10 glycosylhydrolase [Bryobacterales bacterium]